MGDYTTARPYLEQALAIFKAILGEQHLTTAISLNNVGNLLKTMGDYAAARPYYERALAIRQKVLGEQHPETQVVQNNLADLDELLKDSSHPQSTLSKQ